MSAAPGTASGLVVGVARETHAGEARVALVPEVAGKFAAAGARVIIERDAGLAAQFPDAGYKNVEFVADAAAVYARADLLLKVQPLTPAEAGLIKSGAVHAGFMQPHNHLPAVKVLRDRGITSFAMELVPRISRAQSMDALSSQAAIAGYKAVLIAANTLDRFFPMLTTAAGTIRPATVLVIGVGAGPVGDTASLAQKTFVIAGHLGNDSMVADTALLNLTLVPGFSVHNFPNPFSDYTTFVIGLPADGEVSLTVYTRAGERVCRVIDRTVKPAGVHLVPWEAVNDRGRDVVPGTYEYVLDFVHQGVTDRIRKRLVVTRE